MRSMRVLITRAIELFCDSDVEDISWETQSQDSEEEPACTSPESAETEKDSTGKVGIKLI